jgi:hypothetical protein
MNLFDASYFMNATIGAIPISKLTRICWIYYVGLISRMHNLLFRVEKFKYYVVFVLRMPGEQSGHFVIRAYICWIYFTNAATELAVQFVILVENSCE